MKSNRLILVLCIAALSFCRISSAKLGQSQNSGTITETLPIKSAILKKEMKFSIYLPGGYETSKESYPVLYLLHGAGGDRTDWAKVGNVQEICEKSVKEGASAPSIIVMPDAEMTFYMNNARGDCQYEDYFIKELIPYVDKKFRCRTEKKYRSIAGLSMGAYGCLLYALHHPELFASCGAMSAAVRTDDEIEKMPLIDFNRRFKSAMGEMKEGESRITDFWNQNSILYLVKKMPEDRKKSVRFYLDCGDDDEILYRGNAILHIEMRDANIPHEFRMRDGGHNWEYWKSGLPDILRFIAKGIRE